MLRPVNLRCAALIIIILPALATAGDTSPSAPEVAARENARRLYPSYLDVMMPSPEFHGPNITFRIANDIDTGGDGQTPEFYLAAALQHDWVEIRYVEKTSIYSALRKYLLDHPDATVDDQLDYWPATIRKRFTYDNCPELKTRIQAVEQYIRTSLFVNTRSQNTGLLYRVGSAWFDYAVTHTVSSGTYRPVTELLEIRDRVMQCARNLQTVEEADKAAAVEKERAQAEYVKNFKGPLLYTPPAIVAKHGAKTYESALGSYCWGIGSDDLCDDKFALVTPSSPIVVRRGDRIAFEIPVRDWLASMDFAITRVTKNDTSKEEVALQFPELIFWSKEVHVRPMSEAQRNSIVIDKPPGEYILTLQGEWTDYGDVQHGFYLKVIR